MKLNFLLLGFVIALVALTSCASEIDIVNSQREYRAYGQSWKYLSVSHHSRTMELFTTHGYIGEVDRVRQEIIIETENGEKIPAHDRLYALQMDGTYKKTECCYDANTIASVYSVNEKLFIYFLQRKINVTDCFVYPTGRPDDEKKPPMEQVNWIDFFGEFDPVKKLFYIRSFYKGMDLAAAMGSNWKELLAKESIEDVRKRQYLNRAPFVCNAEK